ncbi:18 kDa heat shock protein [Planctomycetes bacterium Pan216]|uniref:18 kDa heat shock protein n=1 Tax=Kolteria novifilia TaxID=2527975 RepID=A0A518B1Q5_9BACT|nr:18 kDa heat shock protein [Planctomycetes bacterium Pan216]
MSSTGSPKTSPSIEVTAPIDVIASEQELVIRADLPGSSVELIDVRFDEGTLSLRATIPPRQLESTAYLLREFAPTVYTRSLEIGEQFDLDQVSADYESGVLTLRLPVVQAKKPRRVPITGG